jgi:hypothetical protein
MPRSTPGSTPSTAPAAPPSRGPEGRLRSRRGRGLAVQPRRRRHPLRPHLQAGRRPARLLGRRGRHGRHRRPAPHAPERRDRPDHADRRRRTVRRPPRRLAGLPARQRPPAHGCRGRALVLYLLPRAHRFHQAGLHDRTACQPSRRPLAAGTGAGTALFDPVLGTSWCASTPPGSTWPAASPSPANRRRRAARAHLPPARRCWPPSSRCCRRTATPTTRSPPPTAARSRTTRRWTSTAASTPWAPTPSWATRWASAASSPMASRAPGQGRAVPEPARAGAHARPGAVHQRLQLPELGPVGKGRAGAAVGRAGGRQAGHGHRLADPAHGADVVDAGVLPPGRAVGRLRQLGRPAGRSCSPSTWCRSPARPTRPR